MSLTTLFLFSELLHHTVPLSPPFFRIENNNHMLHTLRPSTHPLHLLMRYALALAVSPRLLAQQLASTSFTQAHHVLRVCSCTTCALSCTYSLVVARSCFRTLPMILNCCHTPVSRPFSVLVWRITLLCPLPVLGLVFPSKTNDLRGHH